MVTKTKRTFSNSSSKYWNNLRGFLCCRFLWKGNLHIFVDPRPPLHNIYLTEERITGKRSEKGDVFLSFCTKTWRKGFHSYICPGMKEMLFLSSICSIYWWEMKAVQFCSLSFFQMFVFSELLSQLRPKMQDTAGSSRYCSQ